MSGGAAGGRPPSRDREQAGGRTVPGNRDTVDEDQNDGDTRGRDGQGDGRDKGGCGGGKSDPESGDDGGGGESKPESGDDGGGESDPESGDDGGGGGELTGPGRASRGRDSLWRNWDFLAVWGGQIVSTLGSRIGGTAMPMLVIAVTGSAGSAGVVGAAAAAPVLLLGLIFGALADRWPRRRLMLGSQVLAAVASTSVAVVVLAGRVTVAHLEVAAFVGGACAVCYGVAEHAALPQLVPDHLLPAALAQNEAKDRGAGLAGPPLGGLLYGLGAAVPFLLDVLSFAIAAAGLGLVRDDLRPSRGSGPGSGIGAGHDDLRPSRGSGPGSGIGAGHDDLCPSRGSGPGSGIGAGHDDLCPSRGAGIGAGHDDLRPTRGTAPGSRAEPAGKSTSASAPGSLRRDLVEGLRFLWRHPFGRTAVLLIAVSNLVFQALLLVLVVLATGRGSAPGTVGLMFGIYGGGGLLGALVAGRLAARVSPRLVVMGVNWVWAALLPLFAVPLHPLLLGMVGAACAFLGPLWNVVIGTYALLLVPDALRGRVNSAATTIAGGAVPVGSLVAGVLLDRAGVLPTVLLLSVTMALTAMAGTLSRAMPTAVGIAR